MKRASNKKLNEIPSSNETILPRIGNNNQKNKLPNQKRSSSKVSIKEESLFSRNKVTPRIKLSKPNNKNKNINIIVSSSNINDKKSFEGKNEDFNEKRKKRLQQEKKEQERDRKVYEQTLKEYQEKNKSKHRKESNEKSKDNDTVQLPRIKVSEKRAQEILEEGGMLDAYKYLIVQLCKNGLPEGNIFDYASYVIQNYEKKWKEKKYKLQQEKFENYWKEKKELIEKNKNFADEETIKALNRSLEEREINKIIKSLDRSRSSRHYTSFKINKKKSEKIIKIKNKNKLFIEQKGGDFNEGKKKENSLSKNKNKMKLTIENTKYGKEDNKQLKSLKSINKTNSKSISTSVNENKKIIDNKKK